MSSLLSFSFSFFLFFYTTQETLRGVSTLSPHRFVVLLLLSTFSFLLVRFLFRSFLWLHSSEKKPVVALDEDSVKLRLFSLFEAAGANGLQLKQIAVQTGQSLSLIRTLVDEIAEPRKRLSDRKLVYFLKDQYNPYATLAGEEPIAKKTKLS
ncbi:membrane protein [Cystoisospora suis]|uniref:Membrane protein n=1 Tax=Cystoisospora suis TaxID=483139 RepID=A0A2C6LI95_9APIC|nr:membrane protein [Cystoisospora suis]